MDKRARSINGGTNGTSYRAVDPCIVKIEALWESGLPKDVETLAKTLRLFVFYVRLSDGVPEKYQANVRAKIETLEGLLEFMTLDNATIVIPAIKYARRQLKTYITYGTKFRSGISAADQAKARRIGKRIELNPVSSADFEPTEFNATDEFNGFLASELDDEELA
jgi:hypothetical protein